MSENDGRTVMGPPLVVVYTNWRDETRVRRITPLTVWYGLTRWHPRDQWFLRAIDDEDGKEKDFALSGFKGAPAAPCPHD